MKIHPVGSELFHAKGRTDGQTGMTKLILAFRNFAKTHKNKWAKHHTDHSLNSFTHSFKIYFVRNLQDLVP
jgi:hypothetical protein